MAEQDCMKEVGRLGAIKDRLTEDLVQLGYARGKLANVLLHLQGNVYLPTDHHRKKQQTRPEGLLGVLENIQGQLGAGIGALQKQIQTLEANL